MSLFPLDRLLRRLIAHGQLTVVDTDGRRETFGATGDLPTVTMRLHDRRFIWRILRQPGLVLGEGYMDGSYTIEGGTLRDFLEIVLISAHRREPKGFLGAVKRWTGSFSRNGPGRAARNVRHHYDIDQRLYDLFLDKDLQYSCAYWREGVTSLEDAQRDKRRHIAAKLLLQPGMKVLDIGCGWGGLALHLAAEHGVEVTGVTLSKDQYEVAVRRAKEAGLSDRVTIKLQDYRDEPGPFDRIVSVGMFEHVGRRNFAEYFRHLDRLLEPDGVVLLHTIGRMSPPEPVNAWLRRYIFPGAYVPSLSELAPVIEMQGWRLADLEVWTRHYAQTLKAWDERFQDKRPEITAMFDERFCRMWEFYLQVTETSFRFVTLVVFQLQLTKRMGIVPITRDYLYAGAPLAGALADATATARISPPLPGKPARRTRKPAPAATGARSSKT